ncbi:hypothetical protein ABPG74_018465 [Tetrahymena malaccensis]
MSVIQNFNQNSCKINFKNKYIREDHSKTQVHGNYHFKLGAIRGIDTNRKFHDKLIRERLKFHRQTQHTSTIEQKMDSKNLSQAIIFIHHKKIKQRFTNYTR